MKRNTHLQKTEVVPPRVEEPKLVPTAEAKGFPNPAPKGVWVPKAQREHALYCFTTLHEIAEVYKNRKSTKCCNLHGYDTCITLKKTKKSKNVSL